MSLPVLATDKAARCSRPAWPSDAARELDAAIAAFRRQRLDQDLAEAELARAQAALAGRRAGRGAPMGGGAATRVSGSAGNHAWAGLAELTRLHARRALAPGRPRRPSRPRRRGSRRGCAAAGCPTTRPWPSCSRPGP